MRICFIYTMHAVMKIVIFTAQILKEIVRI